MKTLTILIILIFAIGNIYAKKPKRITTATKTVENIKIDGIFDEQSWQNIKAASNFIQLDPNNGEDATLRTEVRFLYDNEALYVAVKMFDNKPELISTQLTKRDEINQCDFFGIYIDPYNTGLTAYGFFVTAAGVQVDMKAQETEDASWNAVWESETTINDEGWFLEIKIPYSALRFPNHSVQTWGINMFRNVQRTREKTTWNFIDKEQSGFINQSGELTGISDIVPPIRLSIMPYLSTYIEHYSETNSINRSIKGGLDLKYGLNESFTLDMMLIPDFGQVQSDDKVLNLSPFEIYYQENRQFFTEGTELFNKGEIFYSRRIGNTPNKFWEVEDDLSENEEIISNTSENQLLNATKLTGRTKSGTGIGFLNAMTLKSEAQIKDTLTNSTRNFVTQPFTNYNVFVVDQSLKNNSYVSLINTNVSRFNDEYYANVTATDFKISNSEKTYAVSGIGAVSQIYETDFENTIGGKYSFSLSKTSGNFRANLTHYLESDKYEPNDLGYLQMNNSIGGNLNFQYNIYNPFWKFIWFYNYINFNYEELYEPKVYSKFEAYLSSYATLENYVTMGLELSGSLKNAHNYYETRVDGRYYEEPYWISGQYYMSTDYRNKLAFDAWLGVWTADKDFYGGFWSGFSPRFRASDKMFILSRFTYGEEQDYGYVDNYSDEEIFFGKRKKTTVSSSLTFNYIFNNKQGISFRARHYWSKADYDNIYNLNFDGSLSETYNYNENPDVNYNAFNIDLIYSWNFAPGSELSIVWKNLINNVDETIQNSYIKNIDNTFNSDQINNFSIKILYYIDYLYVKKTFTNF